MTVFTVLSQNEDFTSIIHSGTSLLTIWMDHIIHTQIFSFCFLSHYVAQALFQLPTL